jgi:hypothetical protein
MFPFPGCTTISVSGCTNSGKTTFVSKLLKLKYQMFDPVPEKILWCYGVFQDAFNEMESEIDGLHFHQGLPSVDKIDEFSHSTTCNAIILDDLMNEVCSNPEVEKLFTQGSHHRRLLVCYLNQNLYNKGSKARTINLNTHYHVLMKNPRDISQIQYLSRQVGLGTLITDAYKDCMKEPYSYLIVDLYPQSDDETRIRTKIFPNEDTIIYTRK